MSISKKVNNITFRLIRGDYTDMELEAIVYYADTNLKLGAGFGNAIAMRGGLSITKELEAIGSVAPLQSVVTKAGKTKAENIIHANGPKFQELDTDSKLVTTINNALKTAEENGFKQVAMPPMGAGFYGIPLPVCAEIMVDTLAKYLKNGSTLEDVIIAASDDREYDAFAPIMEKL